MSTQHLLPLLDTCESFQSSVWHFGSTWLTEDTICMKFTYIKVGGTMKFHLGKRQRKSSCGCIFLKLKGLVVDRKWDKGLVVDRKWDFLLLKKKSVT